ncbi:hypothetical protein L917_21673 [Phytophthora nicotianae]|uniref:Uncharacterized protein n=1 Tax=Phytophthora nicotianae TaxID=4792 RepID=W2JYJ9_PHYNI|nr:hypothetical protein L917_21673 [Phytophthora nicotianae]
MEFVMDFMSSTQQHPYAGARWRHEGANEADLCARREYMVVANVNAKTEVKQRDVVRKAELVFRRR